MCSGKLIVPVRVLLAVGILLNCINSDELNSESFPDDFVFGVATSAYQIEGAWNVNGKGVSIWDTLTHTTDFIADGSNGDIACDSYTHAISDISLIKNLGVDFYRFSISWTRILPTGFTNFVNPDGIRYYNELINGLLAQGIQPMVTIYHWDLPQNLQELGGWTNDALVDYYEDFARVAFENFGDRVRWWTTFNEPMHICYQGYGSNEKAPALSFGGIAEYLCAHTLLKAHARAYHVYDQEFRNTQGGEVSIVLDGVWFQANTTNPSDAAAAERGLQFTFGWYAHPIFGITGDYPEVMKNFVAARSSLEGFFESRLPEFTAEEIEYIRGTADWLGLNHYTTRFVTDIPEYPVLGSPHFGSDLRINYFEHEDWHTSASPWLRVVPWGFRNLLVWIKEEYGNVPLYITENGYSDHGELDDVNRIAFYEQYLSAVLDAIHEFNVNIKGYTFWSLMDNFEWMEGYLAKFGLYHVNFEDPLRTRTAKSSVEVVKRIIANRRVSDKSSYTVPYLKVVVTMLLILLCFY